MKILIVSSEIVKNKYSASLTVYKFIESIPSNIKYDILTEPMTIWDFKHNAEEVLTTDYKIPKSQQKSLLSKIFSKFFKTSIPHLKRYKALKSKLKQIELNQYDAIIAFGGGGFFEPLEALSQIKTRSLTIGFIHDPYPGDVFPEPYKSESTKHSLKIRENLKKVFSNLDKLAFPSKLLGDWMNEYYEFGCDKILELPHLLPLIQIPEDAKKQAEVFLNKHDLKSQKFYFHAGTLLKHRPISDIIIQFKKLKSDGLLQLDFKILFIGNVNYDIQNSDEDVIFIKNRQPLDLINAISRKAKALLVIEHIGDISPFLPGKLPEYIAQEKPIMHFGPQNSETCRIVKPYIKMSGFSAALDQSEQIFAVLKNGGINLSENKSIVRHFKIDTFITQIEAIVYGK